MTGHLVKQIPQKKIQQYLNLSLLKSSFLSALIVLGGFNSGTIIAAEPATPQLTKSNTPLLNLGAEASGDDDRTPVSTSANQAEQGSGQTASRPSKSSATAAKRNVKSQDLVKNKKNASSESSTPANSQTQDWSYAGANGPQNWGSLGPQNSVCAKGKHQSPIDLREQQGIATVGLAELEVRYRDVPLRIEHNKKGLQVNYPLGSTLKLGDKSFALMNYRFHAPSQHQLEGFNYPLEVQMVHKDGDDNFVMVSVLFQEGETNESLATLLAHWPNKQGQTMFKRGAGVNPVNFYPGVSHFFKYSGSLTTPPCTEGVVWIVFKRPIQASAEQIRAFKQRMGTNNRPIQAINARDLLKSWADAESTQTQPLYEFY